MAIISSKIYLSQIQTAATITSRSFLLAKNIWSNLHLKIISKLWGAASSYVNGIYIFNRLDAWCCLFHIWNDNVLKFTIGGERITYKAEGCGLWTYPLCYKVYSYKYLCEIIFLQKHIYLNVCCHFLLQ